MKKVKITIDRQNIDSEEINARRDFQSLMKNYQGASSQGATGHAGIKKFFFKNYLNIFGGSVLVSSAVLIYTYNSTVENKTSPAHTEIVSIISGDQEYKLVNSDRHPKTDTIVKTQDYMYTAPHHKSEVEKVVSKPLADTALAIQQPEMIQSIQKNILQEEALLKAEIEKMKEDIKKLEQEKPIKPVKAKGFRFKIDIDPKEFPRISKYKDVIFEVPEDEKNFSPDFMKQDWDKGKISEDKDGKFKLVLTKEKQTFSFKVVPVFEEKAYLTALQEYEVHQQKIDSLLAVEKNKEKELEQLEK